MKAQVPLFPVSKVGGTVEKGKGEVGLEGRRGEGMVGLSWAVGSDEKLIDASTRQFAQLN